MRSPSRLLLRLSLAALGPACASTTAYSWTPPIGIPAPSFGITQTVSDTAFTHWVDNSKPCSNSGNGTPAMPRCSVPSTLPAGSIVQVRGGPYNGGEMGWTLNGTAAQPVYVRGPASGPRPDLGPESELEVAGTYGIVENLNMRQFYVASGAGNHHLAIRHCGVTDHPGTGGALAVGPDNHDIVVYDCEVARNGPLGNDRDQHGINLYADGIRDVWIVDNHIHHNSGDGIQFCHSCSTAGPANVYIGRNDIHDDEENAIDLKAFVGPVIISQNTLHGYAATSTSNGEVVRINDEGEQGVVWLLFNDIWTGQYAINPNRADASAVYIVGNEIHDIVGEAIPGRPRTGTLTIVNNTIVNVRDAVTDGEVRNNIIRATRLAIGEDVTACSHNFIQQGTVEASCTNGRTGNPLLAMSGIHVAGLQAGSTAADAALANHAAYAAFQTAYGRDIRFDRVGLSRPQGPGWDMGAHERPVDMIFKDGFETGDASRWTAAQTDGGDLTVDVTGAMAGTTRGAVGAVDDTASLYVEDGTPTAERRYRARFYIDPTLFDPGIALGHLRTRVFIAFSEAPLRRLLAVVLRKRAGGQFSIMGRARRDDNTQADTGFFNIGPGAHAIEVDLTAATAPGVADGRLSLWIDGTLVSTLTGIANSAALVDFVRMGALSLKAGAAGVLRFDEFESRRSTYIGPLP